MFTGLVETVGRVRSIKRGAASSVLSIEAPAIMQGVAHWRQHRHQWRMPHRNARRRCGLLRRRDARNAAAIVARGAERRQCREPRARHAGQMAASADTSYRATSTARGASPPRGATTLPCGTTSRRPKPSSATSLRKAPSPLTASVSPWRAFPKTASRFR